MKSFKNIAFNFIFKALPLLGGVGGGLCSCSETDDTQEEFANWQKVNETAFKAKFQQAIASADDDIDTIRCHTLRTKIDPQPEDYIVVEKIRTVSEFQQFGAGSPLDTDYAVVSYSGRLLPSLSYANGMIFDGTFSGDYNPLTALTSTFVVNGTVPGFSTALQNMQPGDYWRVYIPHQLGYGKTEKQPIPAYSTLIFDIILKKYY